MLENENSAYYKEIIEFYERGKEIWVLTDNLPTLHRLVNTNIRQSVENGVFSVVSDFINKELRDRNNIDAYNRHFDFQEHLSTKWYYGITVFYHLKFVGLLYIGAIEKKIEVFSESKYRSLIYDRVITKMLASMDKPLEKQDHQLLSCYFEGIIIEIFSILNKVAQKMIEAKLLSEDFFFYFCSCLNNVIQQIKIDR